MRTHSWSKDLPQLFTVAPLLCLVACSSSSPPGDQVPGGGSGSVSSGGSSTAHAGTGTGGTPGSAAGGAAGSTLSSGGMSIAAGGALVSTGGTGSGGAPISSTGGSGPNDPCATVTCGADQTCSNGTCMCKSGGMACTDGCFDLPNDPTHCGNCTTKCATDAACVDGACLNPTCKTDTTTYNGKVTHYSLATGMVACHYPTNTLPQYYGAMNQYDWADSGVCGACVEITANGKKLVVQITDECPDVAPNTQWCFKGSHHIDLNNAANDALSASGNPSVTWKYVNCTPTGNIKYYFDKGTKQYYLAVTPMNGRNVVTKMDAQVGGKWTALKKSVYNTYVLDGIDYGTEALKFRTTDQYNHVIIESVKPAADKVVDGTKQFAACP